MIHRGIIFSFSLCYSATRKRTPQSKEGTRMSQWIYISDIGKYEGQEVTLKGWLYNKRSSGKLHFLQLRDGTGTIQCVVFKGDVSPEIFQLADHLPQESSLAVTGI